MGADPEFTIMIGGKRADAKKIFENFKIKNSSSADMGIKTPDMKGNIGWDGCSATAEVRPSPANTADGLTENIASLLKPVLPTLPAFDFTVLSIQAPIGGHIHFDLPDGATEATHVKLRNVLVSFYLPVMLGENPVSQAIRLRNYGKLGDYKCEHTFTQGDKRVQTFEFRTPSAEWLASPKVATAVLAYLGTVWNEATKHPKSISKWKDLAVRTDKQMELLQSIANSNFAAITATMLKQIHRAVKTFEFYPEYKNEIDWLFKPQLVLKEKAASNYDLALGWGLRRKDSVNKKTFLSNAASAKQNKENGLDLDFIVKNMPLPYNGDVGVADFASALSTRIAALGWKPKNSYYFFGLKKGTDRLIIGNENGQLADGSHDFQDSDSASNAVNVVSRMVSKARSAYENSTPSEVDPATGLFKQVKKPIIAIGLPASLREKHDVKSALKAIWAIEQNKVEFKNPCVVAQKNSPEESVALAGDSSLEVVDTGSQGLSMASRSIEILLRENGGSSVLPMTIDEEAIEAYEDAYKIPSNLITFGSNTYGWFISDAVLYTLAFVDPDRNERDLNTWTTTLEKIREMKDLGFPDSVIPPLGTPNLRFVHGGDFRRP